MRIQKLISAMLASFLFIVSLPAIADTVAKTNGTTEPTSVGNPSAVNDTTLATDVNAKIAQDATLADTDISASSHKGVITLTGNATTQVQAEEAINVAQSVTGVNSVNSRIVVKNTTLHNTTK